MGICWNIFSFSDGFLPKMGESKGIMIMFYFISYGGPR